MPRGPSRASNPLWAGGLPCPSVRGINKEKSASKAFAVHQRSGRLVASRHRSWRSEAQRIETSPTWSSHRGGPLVLGGGRQPRARKTTGIAWSSWMPYYCRPLWSRGKSWNAGNVDSYGAFGARPLTVTFLLMLFLSRLVDPFVIAAGIVPYFGIRNAPWRSLAGAGVAGAFMGVVYGSAGMFSPVAVASSLLVTAAAACVWWSGLHVGYMIAKARTRKANEDARRPRLVRDEDDWRR